jgi:hypothetical protein
VSRLEGALAGVVSGPAGRVAALAVEVVAALAAAARERLRANRSA